jgi:hypothetical protein
MEYVSEHWPPMGLLFISQVIYDYGEPWWNDIDEKTEELKRKTCPSATRSTTNPTWTEPGTNPGVHSERQVTNHLSHDTGIKVLVTIGISRPRFVPRPSKYKAEVLTTQP